MFEKWTSKGTIVVIINIATNILNGIFVYIYYSSSNAESGIVERGEELRQAAYAELTMRRCDDGGASSSSSSSSSNSNSCNIINSSTRNNNSNNSNSSSSKLSNITSSIEQSLAHISNIANIAKIFVMTIS